MSGVTAQEMTLSALHGAVGTQALAVIERLLADDVRWYGDRSAGSCRSREAVVAIFRAQIAHGARPHLRSVRRSGDRVLIEVGLAGTDPEGSTIWMALTLDRDGRIVQLQDYDDEVVAGRDLSLRARGAAGGEPPAAEVVSGLAPFVQVTDMQRSLAFYELLGFAVADSFALQGETVWVALRSGNAALMLAEDEDPIDPRAQGVLFYLYARDLATLRDHLVFHGQAPGAIVDGSPGPKQEMRLTDPDGYVLMVAQIDADTLVSE